MKHYTRQHVLITGANRGLGLELSRACLQRGDRVFAGCRCPAKAAELQKLAPPDDRLVLLPLDVGDEKSILTAREQVGKNATGLDLLINNAGYLSPNERLGSLQADRLRQAFCVNAVGPLLMAQAFQDLLRQGNKPALINISSEGGSFAKEKRGGAYGYRASKAAQNMISLLLSLDLRAEGIIVLALHPGWMQTDMGTRQALLSPAIVAVKILELVDRLTTADAGKFLTYEGAEHPW